MPLPTTARSQGPPTLLSRLVGAKQLQRVFYAALLFTILYLIVYSPPDLASHASLLPDRMRPNWHTSKPVGGDVGLGDARNPDRAAKPRAAFVVLVRERQLNGLLSTLRDIQWAFNDDAEHGYDFVRQERCCFGL